MIFCAHLSELYIHLSFARRISKPWEDVHTTPFGTTVSFPIPPERLLSPTVRFWSILMFAPSQDFLSLCCPYPVSTMNLQVRGYSQQYFLSGMRTHALNHWMILRGTTLLNSSPLLAGRHDARTSLSRTRFSLSRGLHRCAQGSVIPPEFRDPRTWVFLSFQISKEW